MLRTPLTSCRKEVASACHLRAPTRLLVPQAQACRPQGPLGPTPRPFRPKLFQELCSIIAPVVHPRGAPLSLRPAILVTGPVGAGKRLCAVSVAQSLGIHVVQYSCHELVAASGRSDAKLGAALTAAFESAAEYTPALLVLRRFGALAGQSATGARPTRCCRIILSADMSCLMRAGGVRVSSLSPLLPYLGRLAKSSADSWHCLRCQTRCCRRASRCRGGCPWRVALQRARQGSRELREEVLFAPTAARGSAGCGDSRGESLVAPWDAFEESPQMVESDTHINS